MTQKLENLLETLNTTLTLFNKILEAETTSTSAETPTSTSPPAKKKRGRVAKKKVAEPEPEPEVAAPEPEPVETRPVPSKDKVISVINKYIVEKKADTKAIGEEIAKYNPDAKNLGDLNDRQLTDVYEHFTNLLAADDDDGFEVS